MDSGSVLVVDDDPTFAAVVTAYLGGVAMRVDVASTGAAGVQAFERGDHDVVLLDLGLPSGEGGLDVLRTLREQDQTRPIIILTADTSVGSIVTAMRDGAWDYLSKPIDRTKLVTTVRNAVERRRLLQRVNSLSRQETTSFHGIIGGSAVMRRLFSQIERVARSEVTVAIHGESGSGKELVARALHEGGPRRNGPFVAINCAAIPESLQESEFFGHEKGAFTGAATRRIGRLEQADGGTLFLDEVAELSLTLQAKLLRSLQERNFSRIGGTGELTTNFRLLTATHKDLVQEVAAGRFREDLYYRLAVFDLALPPLRERREDIPLLTHHFLQQQRGPDGVAFRLDSAALAAMVAHPWRGNVRELQNAVYHSLVLANDGVVRLEDLPARVRDSVRQSPSSAPSAETPSLDVKPLTSVTSVTSVSSMTSVDLPATPLTALPVEAEHTRPNASVHSPPGPRGDAVVEAFDGADDVVDDGPDDMVSGGARLDSQADGDIPQEVPVPAGAEASGDAAALPVMTLEALERRAIEEAVSRHGGNLSAVAKELGLGRTTLYRKLQAYRPADTIDAG